MLWDQLNEKYVLIGTVKGGGYDCGGDKVNTLEGSSDGLWNKVSKWVPFIKRVMKDMGETSC